MLFLKVNENIHISLYEKLRCKVSSLMLFENSLPNRHQYFCQPRIREISDKYFIKNQKPKGLLFCQYE